MMSENGAWETANWERTTNSNTIYTINDQSLSSHGFACEPGTHCYYYIYSKMIMKADKKLEIIKIENYSFQRLI